MINNIKETLVNNFLRISKIPRQSGNEEGIANFFINIACDNNLYCYKDSYNNVLIKKQGNIKGESIAIQAHLDMVCVKTKESNHDFSKEGIDQGGLECVTIKDSIGNIDVISIGSTVENYHTVNEITYISSWVKSIIY